MMKTIILTACIAFASLSSVSAKAKIPICLPCESIETVQELPKDSEIAKLIGKNVNVAYMYKQYGALWMSLWNSDGKYVLSDEGNSSYLEVDVQMAKILKEKHNIDIETAGSPLSFWKKTGGKLVFLIIAAIIVYGVIPSKDKEVKPVKI